MTYPSYFKSEEGQTFLKAVNDANIYGDSTCLYVYNGEHNPNISIVQIYLHDNGTKLGKSRFVPCEQKEFLEAFKMANKAINSLANQ